MSEDLQFKELESVDFKVVKEIYDYYILNTTATWHTEPVSEIELQNAIYVGHPRYRSYLVYAQGEVIGYCYFSEYKKRQAYYRSSEVTLYLKPDATGKGYGSIILKKMEEEASKVGIHTLLGVISGDNEGSISLFEKNGYTKCAHLRNMGEKFGKLLDIVCYQKEF